MTAGTMGGYDASTAPGQPPAGDQVVMGYGGGDTPHVWSRADWDSQLARFRIPIWTRSNPAGHDGAAEAHQFLAYLDAVGAPRGILTVVDYETAVDAAFIDSFDAVMRAAGNRVALYGSKSTLFQNPIPSGGYFPADLTGTPHLYPGTLLTQYRFESAWDDDTVSAAAVLWDTRPAPIPAPPTPKEPIMIMLTGMNGTDVFGLSGGLYWHIADGPSVQAYKNAGVPLVTIDAAEHAQILAAVAKAQAPLTLTGSVPLTLSATGDVTIGASAG